MLVISNFDYLICRWKGVAFINAIIAKTIITNFSNSGGEWLG